jgi:hypothetical protein
VVGLTSLVNRKADEAATLAVSSRFRGNLARGGTGFDIHGGGGGQGGAIFTWGESAAIASCMFQNNRAIGGAGGAASDGGGGLGGAIQSIDGGLQISRSAVTKNRALGSTGWGGGIYLTPNSGTVQIRQTVVTQNIASTEGNNIYGQA